MSAEHALLRVLADGAPHSGEVLAQRFGVTRAAIWKQISKLEAYGLTVEATPGRGYRLNRPIDFLSEERIAAALDPGTRDAVAALEVHAELDSTNRHLLRRPAPPPGRLDVALAEFQHAGRGRLGRSWSAPLGGGLCLSVGWQFAESPQDLSALSLAIGVAARRAIAAVAPVEIGLKWPNDLVFDERKLGGVLVELSAEAQGACRVVAGLGINVSIPGEQLVGLSDWPRGAIDLDSITNGAVPGRSELAARLISSIGALAAEYPRTGFAAYAAEWQRAHVLTDAPVRVIESSGERFGIVRGIAADGALVVESDEGERRRVVAGDVTVRRS